MDWRTVVLDMSSNYYNWITASYSILGIIGLVVFVGVTLGGKLFISWMGRNKILYKENAGCDPTSFSIIIPTYNESSRILGKIDRLSQLDYDPSLVELIFVDSSDDDTPELINGAIDSMPFKAKMVTSPRKVGLAGALDRAFRMAENEILMKSDSDIAMRSDVLSNFERVYSDSSIGAASGSGSVKDPIREKFEAEYRRMKLEDRLNESLVDSTHIFDTVATIRRGLFRGIPSDSWADDAELAIQAIRAGKRAIIVPEIGFLEELPTGRKLRKIKSRRAAGHIRLMFQNLDMISLKNNRNYSKVIFPRILLMMVFCPIVFFASLGMLTYTSIQSLGLMEVSFLLVVTGFVLLLSTRIRMLTTSVFQVQMDLLTGIGILIKENVLSKFSRERKTWEVIR